MKKHDKLLLAGELLVEAAKTYRLATRDVDFVKSILMAGAVSGIVSPFLEELGVKPAQTQRAETAVKIRSESARVHGREAVDPDACLRDEWTREIAEFIRFDRFAYNSLKHAGKKPKVKASEDLVLTVDLQKEASYLIESAIDDYKKLPFPQSVVNGQLSNELLELLHSLWTD